MNKLLLQVTLILCALVFATINSQGQVTIGSGISPAKGALLDLKENDNLGVNSSKGLLLPRVALTQKHELNPILMGASTASEKKSLEGLLLFNTSTVEQENLCPGLYIWNASEWERLYGECQDKTSDLVVAVNEVAVDVDGFDNANPTQGIMKISYTSTKPVHGNTTDTWLTVKDNPSGKYIEVDVSPNNGGPRIGQFVVTDGITSHTVKVNQVALEWSVVPNSSAIGASGGLVNVAINHNSTKRSVSTKNESSNSWVTITNQATHSPVITFQANTLENARISKFVTELLPLTSTTGKQNLGSSKRTEFEITQNGKPASDLVVVQTQLPVDVDGYFNGSRDKTGNINFTSSNPINVKASATWLRFTLDEARGIVIVDPKANDGEKRNGTISLTDGIVTKSVLIEQPKFIFSAHVKDNPMPAAGGVTKVLITSNSNYRTLQTAPMANWISILARPDAFDPDVKVEKNTEQGDRQGSFIIQTSAVSGKGGTVQTLPVTFTQKGGDKPVVPPNGLWKYKHDGAPFWQYSAVMVQPFASGIYNNLEIRCDELMDPHDFPLTFDKAQHLPAGATYTIHRDPRIGDYIIVKNISINQLSSVSFTFIGSKTARGAYIFGMTGQ